MAERLYSLLITANELEKLDDMTYEAVSYEHHKAMAFGRNEDEATVNLRAKVILLTHKVKEDSNGRKQNHSTRK